MAISFQLIQEGPRRGVRWWLYPKCVSIGSSRRLSPSLLCRLPLPSCRQGPWVTVSILHTLSLPRDNTFCLGFWLLIWLLMKAALCLPSCQAHFHGFGPFSFWCSFSSFQSFLCLTIPTVSVRNWGKQMLCIMIIYWALTWQELGCHVISHFIPLKSLFFPWGCFLPSSWTFLTLTYISGLCWLAVSCEVFPHSPMASWIAYS